MSTDDLARLWRSGDEEAAAPRTIPNPEEVLMRVKERSRAFDRTILRRDLTEGLAVLVLAFTGVYVALHAPGVWPWLGAALLTASGLWVYRRLHAVRRAHPSAPADRPVAEQLRAEIEKVDAQASLLRTVVRWYVLPLALGGTAWAVTMVLAVGLDLPRTLLAAAGVALACAALFALIGWGVRALNRAALERHLLPYRRELAEMLEGLEEG